MNVKEFDKVYLGYIDIRTYPGSVFCDFYPLYKLNKIGKWEEIDFSCERMSSYNNFSLKLRAKSYNEPLTKEDFEKIVCKNNYYILLLKNGEIIPKKKPQKNEYYCDLDLQKLDNDKRIHSLNLFNLFPIIKLNNDYKLNGDELKCIKKIFIDAYYSCFENELIYLYSEYDREYYGPYRLINENGNLVLSTLNNSNNYLINVYSENDSNIIYIPMDEIMEEQSFFIQKDCIPKRIFDTLTADNIYHVFESYLEYNMTEINAKENIITLLKEINILFLKDIPTDIQESRSDVLEKFIEDFSLNVNGLEGYKEKIINKVICFAFNDSDLNKKKYYKNLITLAMNESNCGKILKEDLKKEIEKKRQQELGKIQQECEEEKERLSSKILNDIVKLENDKNYIEKQVIKCKEEETNLNNELILLKKEIIKSNNCIKENLDKKAELEQYINYLIGIKEDTESLKQDLESSIQDITNKYSGNLSVLQFKNDLDKKYANQLNSLFVGKTKEETVLPEYYKSVSLKVNEQETLYTENLLNYLVDEIKTYRPNYSKNEIVNILLCIMQGFITVFSGSPGTGKTSICKIVSHVLGLDKEFYPNNDIKTNRFVSVSVEKGWNSKRDFIGYYNPITGIVEKNNVKLYDLLKINDVEIKNTEIVFPSVVLLDEANLSPMEFYWSDFIKICDDNSGNETINLGNGEIVVSNCLRFLATINNDHTVETLSPRVISRAFIVSLPKNTKGTLKAREISKEDNYKPIKWEELEKLFFVKEDIDFPKGIKEIFEDIKDICYELQANMISARIEKAVEKYCSVASHNDLFENENNINSNIIALDFVVLQKVLPQIHGNGETYKNNLVKLKEYLKEKGLIRSYEKVSVILESEKQNFGTFNFFN